MALYDCFQFFNEEHILDLRLNILDEYVDFLQQIQDYDQKYDFLANFSFSVIKYNNNIFIMNKI